MSTMLGNAERWRWVHRSHSGKSLKQELIIISVCSTGSKTKEGVVSSVNTGKKGWQPHLWPQYTRHIISHIDVFRNVFFFFFGRFASSNIILIPSKYTHLLTSRVVFPQITTGGCRSVTIWLSVCWAKTADTENEYRNKLMNHSRVPTCH